MTETELLFPILQFVALVAPAIAILMQLLENAGESDSPAFRFLEVAIVIIVAGAGIILGQLLILIEDSTTQIGVFLIFSSLILLAAGIAWRALPFTDNLELSVNSVGDLIYYTKEIIGRLVALSITLLPAVGYYLYFEQFTLNYLEMGSVTELNLVDTHILFSVVAFIIGFRFLLYLLNVGYLTNYTISDAIKESLASTIAGYVVVVIFLAPAFILAHVLINFPSGIVDINRSRTFLTLVYFWMAIVILAVYGIELWAEKEDYSRFAEDDDEEN